MWRRNRQPDTGVTHILERHRISCRRFDVGKKKTAIGFARFDRHKRTIDTRSPLGNWPLRVVAIASVVHFIRDGLDGTGRWEKGTRWRWRRDVTRSAEVAILLVGWRQNFRSARQAREFECQTSAISRGRRRCRRDAGKFIILAYRCIFIYIRTYIYTQREKCNGRKVQRK